MLFQHTAARRRLQLVHYKLERCELFQHTAAWRRLPVAKSVNQLKGMVSTHSRVEAAARGFNALAIRYYCFNTQPRGGGCSLPSMQIAARFGFNTQPRGGGCAELNASGQKNKVSTHSRVEAAAPMLTALVTS